jgi:nitroimidazol reductase NimA-like FMN-containing flavoprotein (pyridoxamine 5'-phosphate oxidase superfamily)
MTTYEPTPRTTLRRHRERAEYDRDAVNAILDEGFICHAACLIDDTVTMIPTAYGRDGERLLLHGAAANHVLKAAIAGAELTVSVTLLDGLVLARSMFNHSINFRSVVIFGHAVEISEPEEKAAALARIVDHMLPGRSEDARWPTEIELTKTRVVYLPLEEVSAKVRTGGPLDRESEPGSTVWAGVIPLHTAAGDAWADTGVTGTPPDCLHQPDRWGPRGV